MPKLSKKQTPDTITVTTEPPLNSERTIAIVREYPGRTNAELSTITGVNRMMLARRMPEMAQRAKPKIFKGAARACELTGKNAITWWPMPTPATPEHPVSFANLLPGQK